MLNIHELWVCTPTCSLVGAGPAVCPPLAWSPPCNCPLRAGSCHRLPDIPTCPSSTQDPAPCRADPATEPPGPSTSPDQSQPLGVHAQCPLPSNPARRELQAPLPGQPLGTFPAIRCISPRGRAPPACPPHPGDSDGGQRRAARPPSAAFPAEGHAHAPRGHSPTPSLTPGSPHVPRVTLAPRPVQRERSPRGPPSGPRGTLSRKLSEGPETALLWAQIRPWGPMWPVVPALRPPARRPRCLPPLQPPDSSFPHSERAPGAPGPGRGSARPSAPEARGAQRRLHQTGRPRCPPRGQPGHPAAGCGAAGPARGGRRAGEPGHPAPSGPRTRLRAHIGNCRFSSPAHCLLAVAS